jgi:tetratricopeptide (TPR) repeat protein
MRALSGVLAGALLALPSTALADKARADKLFEEGRGYLQRKEYALACTAFEQSHKADPAIGTQLNIALCYEQWGKMASAYKAYLEAERLAKAKKDNRAKHARKKVDELEPKLGRLRVSVPASADPYSIFLFNGKEVEREDLIEEQLLDAGAHTVEVRVAGAPPKATRIELAPGERKSIELELPEPVAVDDRASGNTTTAPIVLIEGPRNKGKLYGGLALVGGGTVAIGVASFVSLIARSDYNDAIAMCPGNLCTTRAAYDATQDARSRANAMTFVAAGGIALIGAGVFLVLTSKGEPIPVEGKLTARPLLAPDAVGIAIGGSL